MASGAPAQSMLVLVAGGERYQCLPGETLLAGMTRLGRKGIPVGCVNGGCGVCKVRLLRGECSRTGPISRAHVSPEEEAAGFTLACRAAPRTDVEIEVVGKMKKAVLAGEPSER